MGELYQLIAIDKDGNETIIELNNNNKNNKGSLSFIDSGTSFMKNKETLIKYLMDLNKLDNPDVDFVIKYSHRNVRYLPVIYDDSAIRYIALNIGDEKELRNFVSILIDKIDSELCNSNFYQNILRLNSKIYSEISNGSYLDEYTLHKIRKFYEGFGITSEDAYYKETYKKELVRSLKSYKTIRTLYIFYKMHLASKKTGNIEDVLEYDIPEKVKYMFSEPLEEKKQNDYDDELQKAYQRDGMDGVYALTDYDDIVSKRYKFK